MLRFSVLGPLEATRNGDPVDLGPRKQRAVLAMLLMRPGRAVTTERLLDGVWGEGAVGKENALWVTISRLRAALDPDRNADGDTLLVTRDHGYALEVPPDSIDARQFEDLVGVAQEAGTTHPDRAIRLEAALDLWRGDAYEDVRYEEFAQSEIRRLEGLRDAATEELYAARLSAGVDAALVADLERLTVEHPLRESPVRLFMTALYRSGRQADALREYRRFEERLGEELGIEPTPELRRLEEQVLLHDMGQARSESAVFMHQGNPFLGLQVFREQDADRFFGRSNVVAGLLHRLGAGERLITLVGASGAGKSSIVRAGLVPAIRKQSLPESDRWLIASMVPGSHPFAELESALLRSALDAPSSLGDQLADPETGVLRAVLRVLPDEESRMLLVIDQLEELFTLTTDPDVAHRFLEGIANAVADPKARIMVVATLRADFYTHVLEAPHFGAAMATGIVNVVPMLPNELEEAAMRPAEQAGASIEPALLGNLISDVLGRPGSLPLFEYALTDLYNEAEGGVLTLTDYQRLGGLAGSLTNRAEELFDGLSAEVQYASRQLFLRLVAIADGGDWGRRRATAAELLDLEIDTLHLQTVIDAFAAHRLLTLDRDLATGEPTVEVAHEALLTEWPRLQRWIDDAVDDLRRYATLATAASEWAASERDAGYLWTGRRLDDYEAWADVATIEFTELDREFLDASLVARDRDQATSAATERRQRRRLVGLVAALGSLAVIAVGFLITALRPEPPHVLLFEGAPAYHPIASQMLSGLEQAEIDFDITIDSVFSLSDVEEELRDAMASAPDLVVLGIDVDLFLPDGIAAFATEFGETEFVLLDGFARPDGPPNLSHVTFAAEQGSYLVGVAAAHATQSGIVGFVGGVPGVIDRFRAGFEAGVWSVDEGIRILSTTSLAGPDVVWGSAGFAGERAEQLVDQGADVIYHAIGPAGDAVFEVIANRTTGTRPLWAIGVDTDQARTVSAQLAGRILTSMVKRHDRGVELAVERFLAGERGNLVLGLTNGGVDYAKTGGWLSETTIEAIEDAKAAVVAGDVTVPDLPRDGITAPAPADAVVEITFDDNGCRADGVPMAMVVQDVLQVDARNESNGRVIFSIVGPNESIGLGNFAVTTSGGGSTTLSTVLVSAGEWKVDCLDLSTSMESSKTVASVAAAEPTASATISFDGTECRIETERPIVVGDVVEVSIANEAEVGTGVAVHMLAPGFSPDDDGMVTQSVRELAFAFVEPSTSSTVVAPFRGDGLWGAVCITDFAYTDSVPMEVLPAP